MPLGRGRKGERLLPRRPCPRPSPPARASRSAARRTPTSAAAALPHTPLSLLLPRQPRLPSPFGPSHPLASLTGRLPAVAAPGSEAAGKGRTAWQGGHPALPTAGLDCRPPTGPIYHLPALLYNRPGPGRGGGEWSPRGRQAAARAPRAFLLGPDPGPAPARPRALVLLPPRPVSPPPSPAQLVPQPRPLLAPGNAQGRLPVDVGAAQGLGPVPLQGPRPLSMLSRVCFVYVLPDGFPEIA